MVKDMREKDDIVINKFSDKINLNYVKVNK